MNINTFNTNRPYSQEGQVNWIIADTKKSEHFQATNFLTVHFHDTTRDIYGKVQVVIETDSSMLLGIYIEEQIMAAYDAGDYTSLAPSECIAGGGDGDEDFPYRRVS